ncbi:MAG: hypothetical protein UT48_C0032G0007 [Parcubacteria group bacterium GW2011_GWE2_39_37]|uniref:Uncharacterized protein n=1 Tax=Candidatus Falkowbacteria bacterium GW2011_GWF2_39_8 TaxID=1618642 RepID=A0A0G0Q182_9BACT|nr:MAG: hypothetical protein UT48_C0032G0007 [Parcubacteria group bacterium GW2011_GWE2_39_37]KKR33928.1 MAG: hypothetical protein UT64_C0001G0002 [Candidatus Falkowbacteria bacterium GW2011_GWF2_39_8]
MNLNGKLLEEVRKIKKEELIVPSKTVSPKAPLSYGELSFEESQVVTQLFRLKEQLLTFYEEGAKAGDSWNPSYQEMKEGFKDPQGKVMTLISLLYVSFRLRFELCEIEMAFVFDGTKISQPTGYEQPGDLIVCMNIDKAIKFFCGERFGIPQFFTSPH